MRIRTLLYDTEVEYEWVQLSKSFRGDIPIYAIGTIGFTQYSGQPRIGFMSKPYNGVCVDSTVPGNHDDDPNGYHVRIYISGVYSNDLSFYYFNPTYSSSGWKTFSQASFEKKSITLANGTVVNNVWVYENANINKISPYDIEGIQNNASPVYFNYYRLDASVERMYVLIEKE